MRIAIVDIGTNSTRLLLAEVSGGRVTSELARESTVTRLGDGVDADGSLRDDAMERVYSTLEGYQAQIERLGGAAKRIAILTSAVRDAANGQEFSATVADRFGLEPHILAGDEEAQMTYLGATSERDEKDRTPTLVVDIGGGSTELVIGVGRQVSFHVSTQAGAVRQSERHLFNDPPTQEELNDLSSNLRAIIGQAVSAEERGKVRHAIAVAGTATAMASISQRLDPYDPAKVHGYVLPVTEVRSILRELAVMSTEQRRHITGLDPDRAPTIVAGAMILLDVLRWFGLSQVEISEHDILRGAALSFSDG